jgi:hypothetical protein
VAWVGIITQHFIAGLWWYNITFGGNDEGGYLFGLHHNGGFLVLESVPTRGADDLCSGQQGECEGDART